jgi:hypothetical protein
MKAYRFRFTGQDDLLLLQRVRECEPYLAGYGESDPIWMKCTTQLRQLGLQLETRTVRDRFYLLYRKFMAQDKQGLRRGSTESEALQKESILQEICTTLHPDYDRNRGFSTSISAPSYTNSSDGSGNLSNHLYKREGTYSNANSNNSSLSRIEKNSIGINTEYQVISESKGCDSGGANDSNSSPSIESRSGDEETFNNNRNSSSSSITVLSSDKPREFSHSYSHGVSTSRKRDMTSMILKSISNLEMVVENAQKIKIDSDFARLKDENAKLHFENARLQAELDRSSQRKSKESSINEEIYDLIKYQSNLLVTLLNRLPKSSIEFSSMLLQPSMSSSFSSSNLDPMNVSGAGLMGPDFNHQFLRPPYRSDNSSMMDSVDDSGDMHYRTGKRKKKSSELDL